MPNVQRILLEEVPGMVNDMNEVRPGNTDGDTKYCVYEDTVYNDGDQWKATHDTCQMCSCKRYFSFRRTA